jgi:hypothetical protein
VRCHAIVLAVVVAGCARAGPGERDERAVPGGEAVGPAPFVVEGLVVWSEPIERAPAWVRDYWAYAELVFATVDGAPLPPAGDGGARARVAWQRDVYDAYWTDARATLDPRALALAGTRRAEAYAAIPDAGMFEAVVVLLIQEHLARHFAAAGFEPLRSGCGPNAFARALSDCGDHARSCADVAPRSSPPFRANGAECARRGAACRARYDRARRVEPDACQPSYPPR